MSSCLETRNRKIHRPGRLHWIEILAEEHDLAAGSAQENDVILAIDASGRFDEPLRLDLGDGGIRMRHRMHRQVEETEIVYRSSEPGDVAHDLFAPGESRWMADGG